MKNALIAFMILFSCSSFVCAMGKDERFMTSITQRLVTIGEYKPQEDGTLYSLEEWEVRWGKIKNTFAETRAADSHDTSSESLACSADPVKLKSSQSKTPPILRALDALKIDTEKKN